MPFYEAGRKEGGNFDEGSSDLSRRCWRVPSSCIARFAAPGPPGRRAEIALTDYELATRLSFFLWNTGPDDELLKLAASKELCKPAVLDAQVKRMLADPESLQPGHKLRDEVARPRRSRRRSSRISRSTRASTTS